MNDSAEPEPETGTHLMLEGRYDGVPGVEADRQRAQEVNGKRWQRSQGKDRSQ